MNTYTLSLNRVDFEVHMIELGGTKWMLADSFLLAFEFTRSYDVIGVHVNNWITYETVKRLAHREKSTCLRRGCWTTASSSTRRGCVD